MEGRQVGEDTISAFVRNPFTQPLTMGLASAAYLHALELSAGQLVHDQPSAPILQRTKAFRPQGVYTTFLAAWVQARRQLQQLPQEVAATVTTAVTVAHQQQQQRQGVELAAGATWSSVPLQVRAGIGCKHG
jgi:hypothetical protein